MKNKINRPTFSQNLIKIRKEKGLTQDDVANLAGVSRRMIAYYETEAVKPPIDKVEAISKALDVGINDLLGTNEPAKIQGEFAQLDSRTLKKLKLILSLSEHDRSIIYSIAETFHRKKRKKQLTESTK